jgi:hypothetical protein
VNYFTDSVPPWEMRVFGEPAKGGYAPISEIDA